MSRPTAISPEEQEQIARRIGVLLLQSAPEGWQQMTVEYRATGEHHDLLGEVQLQDGSSQPWEPPEDLLSIFEHLREGMYRPDVGTWLSALYIVERPSSYRIDINFDSEPRWRNPLPPSAYADELRRYPRADENIPDWMREKLNGATGQPGGPSAGAPTAGTPAPDATTPPVSAGPSVSVTTSPQAGPSDVSVPSSTPLTTAELEQQLPERQQQSQPAGHQVPPAPQSQSPQNPAQPQPDPGSDAEFRTAHVFDGYDDQGRPLVNSRPPVPSEEIGPLRQYLESAPQVLPSRGSSEDELDVERPTQVPTGWHTDGVWVWQGAVPYYLAQYGVPPEPALIEHIRNRRFTLSEIDERTHDAVRNHLRGQLELPESAGPAQPAEQTWQDEPEEDPLSAASPQPEQSAQDGFERSSSREALDQTGPQPAAAEIGQSASEEAEQGEDPASVFERLHDRLGEHGVSGELYRIGSHSTEAHCLVQEGPDWVVTPGPADRAQGDVRFARPEQAAAYLLGTLLLNAPAETGSGSSASSSELPSRSEAPLSDSAPSDSALSGSSALMSADSEPSAAASGLPQRGAAQPSQSADSAPERPAAAATPSTPESSSAPAAPLAAEAESAGTSNAEASSPSLPPLSGPTDLSSSAEPSDPLPASDLPRRDAPGRSQPPQQVESPGGHFLFSESSGSEQSPQDRPSADARQGGDPLPSDPPTRMRPMPNDVGAQPGPQSGPQGPQSGPNAAPHGAGVNGTGGTSGLNGATGGNPLPQRPAQSPGSVPPPNGSGQQPQQAPNGAQQQPQPGPQQQRPGQVPQAGPGAPPQQGQPAGQPQQQAQPQQPQQQAQQQQAQQQIQPLSGEPPLTLYRDRHNVVLQPGTEVDRFGEPGGNVCYAVRTPYSHRSLPPQWANRTYRAYRVQRPMQVLRGTAVPWFEQPGGGAAYVLPAAVSDLLADGALVELGGNEAPRPPME